MRFNLGFCRCVSRCAVAALMLLIVMTGRGMSQTISETRNSGQVVEQQNTYVLLGDDLPATTTVTATSVSANGRVVVGSVKSNEGSRAFRWTKDQGIMLLPGLGGNTFDARANAVSADGLVIVGMCNDGERRPRAVIWRDGQPPQQLPAQNGLEAVESLACSADGAIVAGQLESAFGGARQAFCWKADQGMQDLDSTIQISGKTFQAISNIMAISQNGRVCGGSMEHDQVDFNSACVWVDGVGSPIQPKQFSEGTSRFLPVFVATRSSVSAVTVNNEGVVEGLAGRYQNKNRGGTRGFHLANKKFSWLENPDGTQLNFPNAICDDSTIVVGRGRTLSEDSIACLWSATTGVAKIENQLAPGSVVPEGLRLIATTGISADGTIVVGTAKSGERSLSWVARLKFPARPTAWSQTSSTKPAEPAVVAKPDAPPVPLKNATIDVGTVWIGQCRQVGYAPYSMELQIEKREGNHFEGVSVYRTLNGKARFRGAIDGNQIRFTETQRLSGRIAVPCEYSATLEGDRLGGTWKAGGQTSTFAVTLKK